MFQPKVLLVHVCWNLRWSRKYRSSIFYLFGISGLGVLGRKKGE